MKPLWGHQQRGIAAVQAAIGSGEQRIVLTCPTGGGKSRMMFELIQWACDERMPVALYTNRRMLFDQLSTQLDAHYLPHGKRASGHKPALLEDIQLCMTQTELAAVYQKKRRELHPAKLVLIDEAHVQTGDTMQQIIADHEATGAAVVGFTATPLDIGHIYRRLIVAGTTSELRACKALVPALHFGVDEPDLRGIKRQATGEYEYEGLKKRIMTQSIVGRVVEHYTRYNPDGKPTILFACGVAESLWFAKEFEKIGIPAASIDGDEVYWQGELHKSDREMRDRVGQLSRDGDCAIVCNRFVLREGIDWPWLYCGILATVFGSPASYIQSCGRLLRACEGKDHAVILDHGGNWHRHGSINADREWSLEYTAHIFEGLRAERIRNGEEPEPICCPQCHGLRLSGKKCPRCGYEHEKRSRMVVQKDGTLVEHEGSAFPPRRIKMMPDTEQVWRQCYERAKRSKNGMTFNQALGLFFYENHYYPPRSLAMMPTEPMDMFRKVKDVPAERLVGFEDWKNRPEKQRRFA